MASMASETSEELVYVTTEDRLTLERVVVQPAVGGAQPVACFGTEEPIVGTAGDLEILRRDAVNAPRVDTHLFQGADHSYAGHEAEAAAKLAEWAASLA